MTPFDKSTNEYSYAIAILNHCEKNTIVIFFM